MKSLDAMSDDELAEHARRAEAWPDAPAALIERAIGAWSLAAVPPVAASGPGRLAAGIDAVRVAARRLTAVLTFDSWAAAPFAAGLRGGRADTRQFLFSSDGRDVDLRVSLATAGRYRLVGQVLGPDEAGAVELAGDAADAAATAAAASPATAPLHVDSLDAMGEFRFEGIAAGRYRLTLRLGEVEIGLPAIDVGHAAGGGGATPR